PFIDCRHEEAAAARRMKRRRDARHPEAVRVRLDDPGALGGPRALPEQRIVRLQRREIDGEHGGRVAGGREIASHYCCGTLDFSPGASISKPSLPLDWPAIEGTMSSAVKGTPSGPTLRA